MWSVVTKIRRIKPHVSYISYVWNRAGRICDKMGLPDNENGIISIRNTVQIAISLILLAVLLPVGMNQWMDANITGLPQSVQDIWEIVLILVIVLVIVSFIPSEGQ